MHRAKECESSYSHQSLYRLDQFLRVIADSILEDDLDLLDVADIRGRISFHHHQVSLLPDGDGADMRLLTKKPGTVEGGDLDRFHWREAGFNQQLDFAQVAESSHHASVASR